MALSVARFCSLLVESQLASPEEGKEWAKRFSSVADTDARPAALTVAEALVVDKRLSKYQARILLAGRAGPFLYGDYLLLNKLKQGRWPTLFEAVHGPTKHPVWLYFLSGGAILDPLRWGFAARQLNVAAGIVHPCLSRTDQWMENGEYRFAVAEALIGRSLTEIIAERRSQGAGELPVDTACRIVGQAALGLGALHATGAPHGEVRTENIWLGPTGDAALLQIPLSRDPLAVPSTPATVAAECPGLADTFAPELAERDQWPDAACDVYALGCVLYELLSGGPPFAGGDVASKMARHQKEPIRPLDADRIPPALMQVLMYALAKRPEVRFSSANQLAEALAPFVSPGGLLPRESAVAATYPVFDAWRRTQIVAPRERADADGTFAEEAASSSVVDQARGGEAMMEVSGISVSTAPRTEGNRKVVRRQIVRWGLAATLLAAIGVAIAVVWKGLGDSSTTSSTHLNANPRRSDDRSVAGGDGNPPMDAQTGNSHTGEASETSGMDLVADNGRTLWQAPRNGAAVRGEYLPAGTQAVLVVRPADLNRHPEGERLLFAAGPAGASGRAEVEAAAGIPFVDMEQLIVAWSGEAEGQSPTLLVSTRAAMAPETLLARFETRTENPAGEEAYFLAGGRAYLWPKQEKGSLLVVGPEAAVRAIAEAGGEAPPLRREFARILSTTNAANDLTLAFVRGGLPKQGGFPGTDVELLLSSVLGADARAMSLSVALDKNAYLELRGLPEVDRGSAAVAAEVEQRIRQTPKQLGEFLAAFNPSPYGRRIFVQLPQMARFAADYSRVGEEDQQVVVNCYLPPQALHNLAMAVELAWAERGSEARTAAPPRRPSGDGGTVQERLKRSISLTFDREPLERSLQLVADEIGVKIEIVGADLQLDGITKNQSIVQFNERNRPADEILRKIMLKANPDGKLVYVLRPAQPGGPEVLFVTTRAAAAKRKEPIPPELALPPAATGKGKSGK